MRPLKTMSEKQRPSLRKALPVLLAILPAILIALSILHFSVDGPIWDEWLVGGYLDKFSRGTLSFFDLFQQQNEYRQFFPNLIFVSVGWLSRWDVRSWMVVSFFLAGLVSFNIYHLGKQTLDESNERVNWTLVIANLIIFSPLQYENWLQGQQLIYFAPIACLTSSLLIASADQLRTNTRFALCAIASVISSFSSANGMLCWVLLLPILAQSVPKDELRQKKWWIGAWVAGSLLTAFFYFFGYHSPPNDQPLNLTICASLKAVAYFLTLLGLPFAPVRFLPAAIVGFVLISLFVWSGVQFWRLQRSSISQAQRMLPWLMLGAYSVLTALLITIGRSGSLQPWSLAAMRYTTYSVYLPVALVYLISLSLTKSVGTLRIFKIGFSRERLFVFLGAAVVVVHLPIYLLGVKQMSRFRSASLQAKACSLFVNVVADECLKAKVFPDIDVLKHNINAADRLGFIRPGLIKTNLVADIASTQAEAPAEYGEFQNVIREQGASYVASGWAVLPARGEPADAVLLAYEADGHPAVIFAVAMLDTGGDFGSLLFARGRPNSFMWSKSFSLNAIKSERVKLSAWAFDALAGKAYKLDGDHVFEKFPTPEQK
jgi:hypothetical protein